MNIADLYSNVEILWNYLKLDMPIRKSACILVFGSHDTSVAERGIELFQQGWASTILFSGGFGHMTERIWKLTEAETFAKIALSVGIPERAIITENQSTNTGENVTFSLKKLELLNIKPVHYLLVHKPYMERRTYATFKKHEASVPFTVTSPQIPFNQYLSREKSVNDFINTIVGDLQRIALYGNTGFQIPQTIPEEVMRAYADLVKSGFNKRLITSP